MTDELKLQGTDQIAQALAAAQAEMQPAKKESYNKFFDSHYTDLAGVIEAAKPLSAHGVAFVQQVSVERGPVIWVHCRTDFYHKSGQSIEGLSLSVPVYPREVFDKKTNTKGTRMPGPQEIGSAITYAKRYSLAANCGVATEDDDGEAAEGRPTQGKSSWTQVAKGQQVPGAETILDVVESKAGGSWGIKTNGGTYLTKDEAVANQLSECRDKGIEAVITATEQKVGNKTVRVVTGVQEQVF